LELVQRSTGSAARHSWCSAPLARPFGPKRTN